MRAKTDDDRRRNDTTPPAAPSPSAGAARRRWAALIKRVWQVDPLQCPRCGSTMKIISFIEPTQPDVIQKILTHGGLPDEPPRTSTATAPSTPPTSSFCSPCSGRARDRYLALSALAARA